MPCSSPLSSLLRAAAALEIPLARDDLGHLLDGDRIAALAFALALALARTVPSTGTVPSLAPAPRAPPAPLSPPQYSASKEGRLYRQEEDQCTRRSTRDRSRHSGRGRGRATPAASRQRGPSGCACSARVAVSLCRSRRVSRCRRGPAHRARGCGGGAPPRPRPGCSSASRRRRACGSAARTGPTRDARRRHQLAWRRHPHPRVARCVGSARRGRAAPGRGHRGCAPPRPHHPCCQRGSPACATAGRHRRATRARTVSPMLGCG
eukprot:scaffold94025_cov63-Phaeocystis_antarctica.AAC.3